MRIDSMELEPSAVMPNARILRITSGGYKATVHFENNLHSFVDAVADVLKFFGKAHGIIEISDSGVVSATRAK